MHSSARTLGLVSAVLLFGGLGGVVLGNFVTAGGGGKTGAEELAAYWGEADFDEEEAGLEERSTSFITRDGPTSYECQGCDAGLRRGPDYLEPLPADYAPLPPYDVTDLRETAVRTPPAPPAPLPPSGATPLPPAPQPRRADGVAGPARPAPPSPILSAPLMPE